MRGPGLLLWVFAVLELMSRGRGARHAVHWNSSNPRFLKGDYTVQAAMNDYLDVYCPHYEPRVPEERTEKFELYMVNREGYEGCYKTPGALKRWECKSPHAPAGPVRFLEKIQRFTPFSLGIEFQVGQEYYYISVPEVDSVGECLRLRLSVCCRPTTAPITEVPKSQPRGGEAGAGGRSSSQGDPWRQSGDASSWVRGSSALLLTLCLLLLWF